VARWLLLPDEVPVRTAHVLRRLALRLRAEPIAAGPRAAPAQGLLLYWLGGSDGRSLAPPPQVARRLVLLAVHRGALRALAARLQPAALVDDCAFTLWQEGRPPPPPGALAGLVGLRQAPLAAGSSLDAGDYLPFRADGDPLDRMLDRYLTWFECSAGQTAQP